MQRHVVAHPRAVAVDVHQVAVMQHAIDQSSRPDRIAEHLAPFLGVILSAKNLETLGLEAVLESNVPMAPGPTAAARDAGATTRIPDALVANTRRRRTGRKSSFGRRAPKYEGITAEQRRGLEELSAEHLLKRPASIPEMTSTAPIWARV